MKRLLFISFCIFLILPGVPLLGQTPWDLSEDMLGAIKALPIPGLPGAVDDVMKAAAEDAPTGDLSSRKSGPFRFYFDRKTKRSIYLVYEGKLKLGDLFKSKAWDRVAESELADPIISISLVEGDLETKKLPPTFAETIKKSYFNVPSIYIPSGIQIYSSVKIGGVIGTLIEKGMGLPVKEFTMRAGMDADIPSVPLSETDQKTKADEARSLLERAKAMIEEDEKKKKELATGKKEKEPPHLFIEFQMAPGKSWSGPLGMGAITLSDATIFIDNGNVIGYKGNARITGMRQNFLLFLETPINPSGALDFTDFKFGLATPKLTLADFAQLGLNGFDTSRLPGGFLGKLNKKANLVNSMQALLTPLSTFSLDHPNSSKFPAYKTGDEWPDISNFNILLLGPLATVDKTKGPLLKVVGNASFLSHKFASMNVMMSESGLHGETNGHLGVNLGSIGLGVVGMNATAKVHIDEHAQYIGAGGSFTAGKLGGRGVEISMNPTQILLTSPAGCGPIGCLFPLDIYGSVNIKSACTAPLGGNTWAIDNNQEELKRREAREMADQMIAAKKCMEAIMKGKKGVTRADFLRERPPAGTSPYADASQINIANVWIYPDLRMPDPKKMLSCSAEIYYLFKNGIVYVYNKTGQLCSTLARHLPVGDVKSMGEKGMKMAAGAIKDAGMEALNFGKKIPGPVGTAAKEIAKGYDAAGNAVKTAVHYANPKNWF